MISSYYNFTCFIHFSHTLAGDRNITTLSLSLKAKKYNYNEISVSQEKTSPACTTTTVSPILSSC
jgi:hypothetical protein